MKAETRIPRPRGTTNLAVNGLIDILEEKIIDNFLMGYFPFRGQSLDMFTFASLYGVPLPRLKAQVQSGLSDTFKEDPKGLYHTLANERLRLFGGVLGRIGRSDLQIERLLRTVGDRVLGSSTPDPLLLREMNSGISNQIRLTETQLKAIQILESMVANMDHVPISEEAQLTREEILDRLTQLPTDQRALEAHVEGTPDLSPKGFEALSKADRIDYNKEASHDFEKLPDHKFIPPIEDIPMLPK